MVLSSNINFNCYYQNTKVLNIFDTVYNNLRRFESDIKYLVLKKKWLSLQTY
jgi:hypothetical protein